MPSGKGFSVGNSGNKNYFSDGYQFGDITRSLAQPAVNGLKQLFGIGGNSAKNADSDLSDSIAYQEYLNKLSMENAREVNQWQIEADKNAMQFEHDEAQLLRDWQEQMSNTAYQRATADMQKAGINPVLAYAQGGAATPSGAAGGGVSSARQAAQLNLDNVVASFKSLVRELSTSESNARTSANAQMYSSTVNSVSRLFASILS